MSIQVLFFGVIAEQQKTKALTIHGEDGMTVAKVMAKLGISPSKALLIAVNEQQQHDIEFPVHDGDEVAIMPPFSGG
ncbi:MAG: MoaD/ThiS family protein [Mariprofundaceae bacterium]|nr:MoaD/ThiS family protein [Mariprofundaceae bacterium]